MRWFAVLACWLVLSGCSMLDTISLGGQRTLDPSRIYLGDERLQLGRHEDLDDYVCLNGQPLVCRSLGVQWDCRCR